MHHHKHHCDHHKGPSGGEFLIGVIIGGLIGAGAALLMTPQDGSKNRKIVREKGGELLKKAGANFETFKKSKLDSLIQNMTDEIKNKFTEPKPKAKKVVKGNSKKSVKSKTLDK